LAGKSAASAPTGRAKTRLLASRSGWFIKGYRYDIFGAL